MKAEPRLKVDAGREVKTRAFQRFHRQTDLIGLVKSVKDKSIRSHQGVPDGLVAHLRQAEIPLPGRRGQAAPHRHTVLLHKTTLPPVRAGH